MTVPEGHLFAYKSLQKRTFSQKYMYYQLEILLPYLCKMAEVPWVDIPVASY